MAVQALTGQYLSPGTALTHLEELFGGGGGGGQMARRRGVTVVLIDEMDLLMTRNQQVSATAGASVQPTFWPS